MRKLCFIDSIFQNLFVEGLYRLSCNHWKMNPYTIYWMWYFHLKNFIQTVSHRVVTGLEQGNEKEDSRYVEEDWEEGDINLAGAMRQE